MSRVFFLQQSRRFDTEAAAEFGSPIYLFDENSLRTPLNPSGLIEDIETVLDKLAFDCDSDYVALTGPAAQLALFVGAVMSRYPAVRLLVFDARHDCYVYRGLEVRS